MKKKDNHHKNIDGLAIILCSLVTLMLLIVLTIFIIKLDNTAEDISRTMNERYVQATAWSYSQDGLNRALFCKVDKDGEKDCKIFEIVESDEIFSRKDMIVYE